jgi:hypothetical protein
MADEEKDQVNGLKSLLANKGNLSKIATIVLIALTGGGNALITEHTGSASKEETTRAIKEIHELRVALDEQIDRSKRMLEILEKK